MAQTGLLFARVDDRLLHGQVAVAWNREVKANLMLIASDAAAHDKVSQDIMSSAAPSGVSVEYCTVGDAAARLEALASRRGVFLLVESPSDLLKMLDAGANIRKVNVGNMRMGEGRHKATASVSISEEDVAAFKVLEERGIELSVQRTPTSPLEDASLLLA